MFRLPMGVSTPVTDLPGILCANFVPDANLSKICRIDSQNYIKKKPQMRLLILINTIIQPNIHPRSKDNPLRLDSRAIFPQ